MQLKADIRKGPPRVRLNYGGVKMFVARRAEKLPRFIQSVADWIIRRGMRDGEKGDF